MQTIYHARIQADSIPEEADVYFDGTRERLLEAIDNPVLRRIVDVGFGTEDEETGAVRVAGVKIGRIRLESFEANLGGELASDHEESKLILFLESGDESHFDELYARLYRVMNHYLRCRRIDEFAAVEMAHETLSSLATMAMEWAEVRRLRPILFEIADKLILRDALELRYYDGLSDAECVEILNIPLAAFQTRIKTALDALVA